MARRIRGLTPALLANAFHGTPIAKEALRGRAAMALHRRHGRLDNLFKEELPGFWRLLYTVFRDEDDVVHIAVLEIVDHPTYDKWFPGRGR